jgi:hypothetical protein
MKTATPVTSDASMNAWAESLLQETVRQKCIQRYRGEAGRSILYGVAASWEADVLASIPGMPVAHSLDEALEAVTQPTSSLLVRGVTQADIPWFIHAIADISAIDAIFVEQLAA